MDTTALSRTELLQSAAIAKAKLVLTDDLIAAAERVRAAANEGTE